MQKKVAKCRCLHISALSTVIMKHVLPGTSLSFKVEKILNFPRRWYSPNLRQHGPQRSSVDFCLIVLVTSQIVRCRPPLQTESELHSRFFMFWFIIPLFTMALQSSPPVTKACTAGLSLRPSICLTVCERKKCVPGDLEKLKSCELTLNQGATELLVLF